MEQKMSSLIGRSDQIWLMIIICSISCKASSSTAGNITWRWFNYKASPPGNLLKLRHLVVSLFPFPAVAAPIVGEVDAVKEPLDLGGGELDMLDCDWKLFREETDLLLTHTLFPLPAGSPYLLIFLSVSVSPSISSLWKALLLVTALPTSSTQTESTQ